MSIYLIPLRAPLLLQKNPLYLLILRPRLRRRLFLYSFFRFVCNYFVSLLSVFSIHVSLLFSNLSSSFSIYLSFHSIAFLSYFIIPFAVFEFIFYSFIYSSLLYFIHLFYILVTDFLSSFSLSFVLSFSSLSWPHLYVSSLFHFIFLYPFIYLLIYSLFTCIVFFRYIYHPGLY